MQARIAELEGRLHQALAELEQHPWPVASPPSTPGSSPFVCHSPTLFLPAPSLPPRMMDEHGSAGASPESVLPSAGPPTTVDELSRYFAARAQMDVMPLHRPDEHLLINSPRCQGECLMNCLAKRISHSR